MSVVSRAGVVPKAVIAALIGTLAGAAAGIWSLTRTPAHGSVSASSADHAARSPSSTSAPKPLAVATDETRTRPSGTPAAADDDAQVLQRARTLARRPDVTALLALREDAVRRATERGIAGSSSAKRELDEIDFRLNEARLLQLKMDAEELRKDDPNATR